MKASEAFVRLLVRRPLAYRFRDEHKGSIIPGVVVLDADGTLLAAVDLKSKDAATALLAALAPPPAPTSPAK